MIGVVAALGIVALIVLIVVVAACAAVGLVIGDAVGSIGRGRRRAPDVGYWTTD